jgi:hypothetical protein
MIKTLEIKNFKSIKHLQLDCKKVNVFIGKPNTGKSNLLESVGILSLPYASENFKDILRFENIANLFYDQDVNEKIEVTADIISFRIKFENGKFKVSREDKEKSSEFSFEIDYDGKPSMNAVLQLQQGFSLELDYDGKGRSGDYQQSPIKFYRFVVMDKFARREAEFLLPPKGENLLQILLTNKELRRVAADLFGEYGLRIVLKPQEHKIETQKEIDDVIISSPYSLVSDTLQRVIFYLAAMATNKDSTIIFEEPEAHAFPYYTKFLAERIALDKSNQYFVSTHNPYFLLSVLEKTPKDEIGIFITYFEDYQTKIRSLTEEEMSAVLDLDASVFFNLNQFLEEK